MIFTTESIPVWEHIQCLNLEKLTGKLVKTPVLQVPHCLSKNKKITKGWLYVLFM